LKRILISRTDSIGDVTLTLPLCVALKKKYPELHITFLAARYTISVIESCTSIDEIIDYNDLLDQSKLGQINQLKEGKFDAIVHVFPNKEVAVLAKAAKIPQRIGTSHRGFHLLTCNQRINFTRKKSEFHEAQLNFHLLRNIGWKELPTWADLTDDLSYFKVKTVVDLDILKTEKPKVILHTKSQGSAVEWPIEKYIELSDRLIKSGCRVFFTGTEKEGLIIRPDVEFTEDRIDTTGQFSLSELVSFIDHSDMLVACSTGPLHLSGILNKNCIGLFTPKHPMHPGRWRPLGRNSKTITSAEKCPCKSKEKCTCLEDIAVEQVYHEIQAKLKL
jgi:heptosyltransferase III